MKKLFCIILAVSLLCGLLAGCSGGDDPNGCPRWLTDMQKRLSKLAAEHGGEIIVGEVTPSEYSGYEIPIQDTETNTELTLWFQSVERRREDQSFLISLDSDSQQQAFNKFITIFNRFADPSLNQQKAAERTQAFINTSSPDKFSDIFECGDYLLVLCPIKRSTKYFRAVYKPCVWEEIDESEHVIFEAGKTEDGAKIFLTGTVQTFSFDYISGAVPSAQLEVLGEDGNVYRVVYAYEYKPVSFDVGTKIKILGEYIKPKIRADKIETLEPAN